MLTHVREIAHRLHRRARRAGEVGRDGEQVVAEKKRWKNDPVLNVTRQGMAKAEPAWGWAVTQNSTDPQ